MAHYSGVFIANFKQVNNGLDLSRSFQKQESRKSLEKSHAWLLERLSRTRKFFKGDHWIVPKLKTFSLKRPKQNKNLIYLVADSYG